MTTFQHCQSAIAIAALLVGIAASATTMSKPEYTAAKSRVSADYKIDKAACAKFSGNDKDVCQAQTKGKHSVALAEIEYSYTGKLKDASKVAVDDKREANYKVAAEKCDSLAGDAKAACMSDAKARFNKS